MEISFPDDESQRLFEGQSRLRKEFGDELASLICCRVSILVAAANLSLVPTLEPVDLRREKKNLFSVALGLTFRLRFKPTGRRRAVGNAANITTITHIEILGVAEA